MLHSQDTPVEADAVSIAEAARRLGVSRTRTYRLLDDGELDSFHVGRRRLIPVASIRGLINRGVSNDESDAVADLLERTRTKRGMALVIDDPDTIAKVSAILAASGGDAA